MSKLLPKIRLAVGGGVLGWIVTKLMLFTDYADSVGGYENVVWPTVISAALPIILDGLITIGALRTPAEPKPADQKPAVRPVPPPREDGDLYSQDDYPDPGQIVEGIRLGPKPLRRDSGFTFSQRSLTNRTMLDLPMQRVATRGLKYCPYDWVMIESGRTDAEQIEHYRNGTSKTLDSRHIEDPAQAFDIKCLDENGKATDDTKYYIANAKAIRDAADDEGIKITSGALDFGWDFYHFERSRKELPYTRPSLDPDIKLA